MAMALAPSTSRSGPSRGNQAPLARRALSSPFRRLPAEQAAAGTAAVVSSPPVASFTSAAGSAAALEGAADGGNGLWGIFDEEANANDFASSLAQWRAERDAGRGAAAGPLVGAPPGLSVDVDDGSWGTQTDTWSTTIETQARRFHTRARSAICLNLRAG